jgi:predicted permease
MFADLRPDLRHAIRILAKSPGTAALMILPLALGIAVNSVIFSYINALLLRPPTGVPSPRTLVEVWEQNKKAVGVERFMPLTYPDYLYYRDHAKTLSGFVAFDGDPESVIWNRAGNGEVVQGQIVSGNFFSALGIRASLGRAFSPDDDQPSAPPVVALSNSFWRGHLASDPSVVGKTLMLNGVEYRVVGVIQAGFEGLEIGNEPDLWFPTSMTEKITRDVGRLASWDSYWLFGVGRLKPGVGIAEARAEVVVISQQVARDHPQSRKDIDAIVFPQTLVPGPFRGYVEAFTGLLMFVVALVLTIACTNAANLMLARAAARRREMAIRSAMGATRSRLVRHVLVESTLLAAMAGCTAFLLAAWISPVLLALKPSSLPVRIDVPADWRVMLFTAAASLVAGVIFGLAPALSSAKTDLTPALSAGGPSAGREKSRLRTALVVAQIASCALLLVGAGLCVRSLLNAHAIDPGFDVKRVAVATIDPGSAGYDEAQRRAFYDRLLQHVENLPGVTSASWVSHLPLSVARDVSSASIQTTSGKRTISIDILRVANGYFQTMGIPFLRGRDFTAEESRKPGVLIVNEQMAREFWRGQDPIGKQVKIGDNADVAVIGVVKTGKSRTLGEAPVPVAYLPTGDMPQQTLVARTVLDPRSLLDPIRRAIQNVDPNLAATDLETLRQFMTLPLFPARVTGILLGCFGMLALVLATIGLFGVISYTTSQRTREIGLRVALGAQKRDIVKLILSQGLSMAALGITIGIGAALGVMRLLSSLLYGIRADDPATLIGVSIALIALALLACYLPARRAMRVDPMEALRYE